MGALATPTPWLPQDDILLKNSVEGGASLESLARGAVEFSRKFTLKELQDRWQSLLYDPAVSAQACARMAEYELSAVSSKAKKADIPKGSMLGDGKRKTESVRSCYRALRKRVCSEPPLQGDYSFLMDDPLLDEAAGIGVDGVMIEHSLESNFGMRGVNFDGMYNLFGSEFVGQHSTFEVPIDQSIVFSEQISHGVENCNGIAEMCYEEEICDQNIFELNIDTKPMCNGTDTIPDYGTTYGQLRYSSSMPDMPAWKTMGSMFLSDTPDDVAMTVNHVQTVGRLGIIDNHDVGEGTSESGAIHLQSVLANPMSFDDLKNPTGCAAGPLPDISDNPMLFDDSDDIFLDDLNDYLLATLDYAADDEMVVLPGMEEPAATGNFANPTLLCSVTYYSRFPEYCNGVICCVLNTEDPEIPSNDDIIFPSKQPASGNRKSQNKATVPSSCGMGNTVAQVMEKGCTTTKNKTELLKKSQSTPNLVLGVKNAVNSCGVQIETPRGETCNGSRILTTGCGGLHPSSSAVKKEHPDLPAYDIAKKSSHVAQSADVQMNGGWMNEEAQQRQSALNFVDPVLEEGELVSSEREEQYSDSDADIPSFSDVESMVLGMDLCPVDQDAFYATKGAMKKIIRLEQNAHAHMQRDMASHGAFAVLSGMRSRHYIKKPEVLLGRATDGVNVDIDLTREGHAKKISRRQASITMNRNGSFSLKNMGRWPIHVNSEELLPGKSLDLYPDCLIDIRGMHFIFNVNQPRVKLYLDNNVFR